MGNVNRNHSADAYYQDNKGKKMSDQLRKILLTTLTIGQVFSCKHRPSASAIRNSSVVDLLGIAQTLEVDTLKLAAEEKISVNNSQQLSLNDGAPTNAPTEDDLEVAQKKAVSDAENVELQKQKFEKAIEDAKASQAALAAIASQRAAAREQEALAQSQGTLMSVNQDLDNVIKLLEGLNGNTSLDKQMMEGVLRVAEALKQNRQVTEQASFNLGRFYNWGTLPPEFLGAGVPFARHGHVSVANGDDIYIFAGLDAARSVSGAIFNITQRKWRPLPAWAPQINDGQVLPLINASAVTYRGSVILWGGEQVGAPANAKSYLDYGLKFEEKAAVQWSKIATSGGNAPTPRRAHVAAVIGDKMFVWGGWSGLQGLADGASYDFTSGQWTPMPSGGPTPRWGATAVVINGKIYIWGGHSSLRQEDGKMVSKSLSDGAVFDPSGAGSWSPIPATNIVGRRGWHVAAVVNNKMVVWGGSSFGQNPQMYNDGGVFSPDSKGEKWHRIELPNGLSVRNAAAGAAVSMGNESGIYIWGGMDGTNKDLADGAVLYGRPHP